MQVLVLDFVFLGLDRMCRTREHMDDYSLTLSISFVEVPIRSEITGYRFVRVLDASVADKSTFRIRSSVGRLDKRFLEGFW